MSVYLQPRRADEAVRRAIWLPRACWSYVDLLLAAG